VIGKGAAKFDLPKGCRSEVHGPSGSAAFQRIGNDRAEVLWNERHAAPFIDRLEEVRETLPSVQRDSVSEQHFTSDVEVADVKLAVDRKRGGGGVVRTLVEAG
jgi:hypothetical protein